MGTIAFALLVTVLAQPAAPSHVKIELVFSGIAVPAPVVQFALAEARAVWAPYGVEVMVASADHDPCSPAIKLSVTFLEHRTADVQSGSLGSIPFTNGTPLPVIALYVGDASALIALSAESAGTWPSTYRQMVEGRTIGRALAHEIGHYMLRSPEHSRLGLMRARQSVDDLMSFDRRRFSLSPGQIARLRMVSAGVAGLH